MTDNSPLEIELVRERQEKLDEERQGLSDLISKLKEMRDTMTASMADIEKKQSEAEKWSNEFHEKSQTIARLNSDLARSVAGQVQDKIETLEESVTGYKKASIEHAQSLAEKLNNAIAELHRAFNARASDLDERFEKFSSKHFEHMEQINKVYHRMHVVYETFQASVKAMEISSENATQAMQRQVGEIEEKIQAEQDSNEMRIIAITDALKRTMADTLGKFQQQIHEEANEMALQNSELQNLLEFRDETVHAKMRQMWLGVMLCAVISLVAFILSRF